MRLHHLYFKTTFYAFVIELGMHIYPCPRPQYRIEVSKEGWLWLVFGMAQYSTTTQTLPD